MQGNAVHKKGDTQWEIRVRKIRIKVRNKKQQKKGNK